MEIKADVKSINKLKDYFFIVPDYQREYVWKAEEQIEQFLIDIDNEYDENTDVQSSYFLGSIIIVENDNKYDVIDGQQRLTTVMLALCAFRDILRLRKSEMTSTQEKYLKTIEELLSDFDMDNDVEQLRLELQYEESSGFLEKLINSEPYTDDKSSSVTRMEQAYEKLKHHYEIILDDNLGEFIKYIKYFLTKVELVIIESENVSGALKIFETINQRGAGLNAMDLVKNLLFAKANPAEFEKIKDIWKEIMVNLQKCKEDGSPLRFLRYFIIARYHNGVIREDGLYKWFISKEGIALLDYENNPVKLAKELKKMSQRYSELVLATELVRGEGQYPNVTKIGLVNKYKSRQHLILLLALAENADKETIEYLASQLESYFFYTNSLSIQAKYNESNFTKWVIKLRNKSTIEEVSTVVESEIVPYIKARLEEFKNRFVTLNHNHFSPLYRERYVLGKIENTIRSMCNIPQQGNDFIYSLQIEHILPQTPKDGILPEEFTDMNEYKSYVHRLGNVTLLEGMINQAVNKFNDLNSDWFNKKQGEYANSDIISTKLLDDEYSVGTNTALNRFKQEYDFSFEKWDKEAIKKRQEFFLKLAFLTWKFNGIDINSPTEN